jgi:four helix bundle protein
VAHQPIEDLELFHLYEEVADWTWDQVKNWSQFHKDTVGEQLVTAVDSVNANLVEGDGRYTGPDSIRFFIIARASAREARLWLRRAKKRSLVPLAEADEMIAKLTQGTRWLNQLIAYRRRAGKVVREERVGCNQIEWSGINLVAASEEDPFTAE